MIDPDWGTIALWLIASFGAVCIAGVILGIVLGLIYREKDPR